MPDRKWLIHPDRWNVADVLKKAGIGEYELNGKTPKFLVSHSFSEVEVELVKPRRIPSEIACGNYDIGITGTDCVNDSINVADEALSRLVNLRCGYVDLAFMTNSARWREVESKREVLKDILGNDFSDLELFLAYYGDMNRKVDCRSEYANVATNYLASIKARIPTSVDFEFSSEKSIGDTESCLFLAGEDRANLILETYATGEHARNKDLRVLDIFGSSTAGLYVNSLNAIRRGEILNKLVKRIHGRIHGAIKDIEKLVQVRFVFELSPKDQLFEDFSAFLFQGHTFHGRHTDSSRRVDDLMRGSLNRMTTNPLVYMDRIFEFGDLPSYSGISTGSDLHRFFRLIDYPYDIVDGSKAAARLICNHEITEDKMEAVASTLAENVLKSPEVLYKDTSLPTSAPSRQVFNQFMSWFGADLREITFFRLRELYGYCPIVRSGVDKYPIADVDSLRPEHLDQAVIYKFNLGNN